MLACVCIKVGRKSGGTGVGLCCLSKRLECLGGTCGVRNRHDGHGGCCFWFAFPHEAACESFKSDTTESMLSCISTSKNGLHDCEGKPRSISPASFKSESETSISQKSSTCHHNASSSPKFVASNPIRVLLVDDSPLIRKATSRALTNEGFEVSVAQHGEDCLSVLESSKTHDALDDCEAFAYDLVIMDLQMPVMGGLEATKRIRALEKEMHNNNIFRNVVIIGFSAGAAHDVRADCILCGMDGFIEKPLRVKDLQTYIQSFDHGLGDCKV